MQEFDGDEDRGVEMVWSKTECKSGHLFSAENTRIDRRTGRRSCKECGRIRSREHQRKRREGQRRRGGIHNVVTDQSEMGRGPKGDATASGPSIGQLGVQP